MAAVGEVELAGMQATPGLLCSKKPRSHGGLSMCGCDGKPSRWEAENDGESQL